MARGMPRRAIAPPKVEKPVAVEAKESAPDKDAYLGSVSDKQSIRAFEERQRFASAETAAGYTRDGKFLFEQGGETSRVAFERHQLADLFAGGDGGGVLTHNHPSGTSFSPADILFFFQLGLSEIRVASSKWNYSLKDPNGVLKQYRDIKRVDTIGGNLRAFSWIGKNPFEDIKQVEMLVQGAMPQDDPDSKAVWEASARNEISYADFTHERMLRLAAKLGLEYTRTPA